MDVSSLCRLRTASLVWRRERAFAQTVVCKATFSLRPDVSPLADEQEHPHESDVHWNDEPAQSLYAPSDLVPFKPRADVLLVGKAFAREPAASITVRLSVASIDKRIDVHSDRAWSADGKLLQAPEFTSMPLFYERAAGGPGSGNPVGVRHVPKGATRVPNLVPHGFVLADQHPPIPPVGFGAVAPRWPDRARRLGRHAAWLEQGPEDRSLPDDFDMSFFNAAPLDQQVDLIRDDERIVLENLHRDHPRLVTALPGVRPWAFVETGGERRETPLYCDTLWIDTDRAICTLTWRGVVALRTPHDAGRIVVDLVESDRDDTQHEMHGMPSDLDLTVSTLSPSRPMRAVLPFAPAPVEAKLSVGEALVLRTAAPPPEAPNGALAAPPVSSPRAAPRKVSTIGPWVPPGEVAVAIAERAAPGSALSASNAALLGEIRPERAEAPHEPPAASPGPPTAVELLWADLTLVGRIRKKPAWKPVIAQRRAPPRDEEPLEGESSDERRAAKDRRDVLAVLRRGEPAAASGIEAEVSAAMEEGAFVPPLALVEGDLELAFDEKDMLKATLGLLAPFRSGDRRLKEQCEMVEALLSSPWLDEGTAGMETFTARLRDTFAPAAHGLPPGYLEARADRLLLERRRYQKRTLLGREWIRALFTPAGEGGPIPTYLDAACAKDLPIFQRFGARAIVEIRLQLDQFESHDRALRVVALGRVVARPGR